MKKNLLILCSSILMTLSLASCDGKETKINDSNGKEIVNDVVNKTNEKIEEVAKGNVIGLSLNGESKETFALNFNDVDSALALIFPSSITGEASTNVEAQLNLNVDNIRKEPADMTGTQLYVSEVSQASVATTSYFPNQSSTDETYSEISSYLNGKDIITFTKENKDEQGRYSKDKLKQEEIDEISQTLCSVLDLINEKEITTPSFGEIVDGVDISLEQITMAINIANEAKLFFTDKKTADEFVTAIDQIVAQGQLFENPQLASLRGTIVSALDIIQKVNPSKYLDFTKVSSKKTTTLTTSFKYGAWSQDVKDTYNNVLESFEETSMEYLYLSTMKDIVFATLPEELNLVCSLGINSDGYLSSFAYDLSIKGSLPKELVALVLSFVADSTSTTMNAFSISYDVTSSSKFSVVLVNDEVEVKTLTMPE